MADYPERWDRKSVPAINPSHPVHRDIASSVTFYPYDDPRALFGNHVEHILNPHPDIPTPDTFPPALVRAATAYLDAHSEALQPADHGMLVQWLLPICGAVRNPPTEEDFKRRVGALEIAAGSLPAFVFSPSTQRLGLSTWVFMPAVADLLALVSEAHGPALERLRAVRRIAGQ